jgi:hypothetical protein
MGHKETIFLEWTCSSSYNINVNYIYNDREKENTCLLRSTELLS